MPAAATVAAPVNIRRRNSIFFIMKMPINLFKEQENANFCLKTIELYFFRGKYTQNCCFFTKFAAK